MADTSYSSGSDNSGADAFASSDALTSPDQDASANIDPDHDGIPDADDDEDILETARARLALAIEAERDMRSMALEDKKFLAGEQWPDNIKAERDQDERPCLTVNRLPQFTNQVVNDQKQNRPSIKVHAVDSGASEDTAKTIQGLIRHIEYNSNAEVAYDQALEDAAEGGFGYFRIRTGFASPDTFDQEIYIDAVENPFSVYFDPLSKKLDGSDANWAFIVNSYPEDDYKALYPQSEISGAQFDWDSIGNQAPDWVNGTEVKVAEYFYKENEEETLHLLNTGETVREKDLLQRLAAAQAAGLQVQSVRTRKTKIPKVCWVKTNGIEVLEKTDWAGTSIPIIPVYGKRRLIDGKKTLESVHRHAKDPQKMLNFYKSAEAEAIALAPRAPFVGVEGQFEGHETEWATANKRNHAYLEYKATTIAGQPAPPPQRMNVEPAVGAITQGGAAAADDLKGTTGIYDAGMGAQSNEVSGVAIGRRAGQVQAATFHFGDNLKHSMRHAGKVLIEVIPKIYDTARTARIIHDDGTHEVVKLNQPTGKPGKDGKELIYDLSVGRYDVTVDVGPSYASKRQEAADSLMQFAQAIPQASQVAADLIARNMDWPGAQEIADRLKKTLPPQLQDDGKGGPPIPPQAQAQIQQMQGLIQQLTQHLNETTKVIETKKLDLEHRERVEAWNIQLQREKLQAEIEMNLAKLGNQASIALLQEEIGSIKHENALMNERLKLLGINQPIEAENDFNPQQADGGNYAGVGHLGAGPTGGPGLPETPGSPMEGN